MITKELRKRFFTETEHSGRFMVVSFVTGVKYFVEPIGDPHTNWGDLNPSTKKVEGTYGSKYKGSINEKDSLITVENGFKCIGMTGIGGSPFPEIQRRDDIYEQKGLRRVVTS